MVARTYLGPSRGVLAHPRPGMDHLAVHVRVCVGDETAVKRFRWWHHWILGHRVHSSTMSRNWYYERCECGTEWEIGLL